MKLWTAAIAFATRTLEAAGVPSPGVDARLIAEHVAGGPLVNAPLEATPEQQARMSALTIRRANREPLQHVLGVMWFRYLTLESRPGVFIVRPETEQVVEAAIRLLPQAGSPDDAAAPLASVAAGLVLPDDERAVEAGPRRPVVVDMCTGSGAIAISMATETNARVYAVELDPAAFDLAAANIERCEAEVELRAGDARTEFEDLVGRVDMVVTNPPYVPPTHELGPEAGRDPDLAMFGGGPDGLDLPRLLVARALKLLAPGGILIMEHADEQGAALREAALTCGFVEVSTGADLAGRDRFLIAKRGA